MYVVPDDEKKAMMSNRLIIMMGDLSSVVRRRMHARDLSQAEGGIKV